MNNIPQSIDVEIGLLGTFLVFNNSIQQALEQGLVEESFLDKRNQIMFNTIKELHNENKITDVTTVIEKLKETKKLNDVGGIEYITQLSADSGTRSAIDNHVGILEDKRMLRQLLEISSNLNYNILKSGTPTDQLMDMAEKEILEITRSRRTTEFSHAVDIVPRLLKEIEHKSEIGTGVTGLKTGFSDLDRVTGGLQNGDLIIIGARPSVGKTAFALNLGKNMAEENKLPIAIFSLEMPENVLMQ